MLRQDGAGERRKAGWASAGAETFSRMRALAIHPDQVTDPDQIRELAAGRGIHENMPRYCFHVINDIDAPDDEGMELASLAAAHLKAIDFARDLASSAVRQGRLDSKHRIDVEDESGEVLLKVTFADAIEFST